MRQLGRLRVSREAILSALGVRKDLTLIDMTYEPDTLTFVFTLEGPGLPETPEGNSILILTPDRFLGEAHALPD